MTSKEFIKINNIINCNLTLEDGTDFTIFQDLYIYMLPNCVMLEEKICLIGFE